MMSNEASQAQPVVLVVDDDPFARLMVRDGLEPEGFRIEEAADGRQALEVFRTVRPHIVLLDVDMPGMSGIEACAALRKLPGGAQVPVLMVTGRDDTDSIAHSYEAGASDFMVKPVHTLILAHRIRYMLRASRAFRALAKSTERLTHAQHIARVGSWDWDPRTDALEITDQVARIFGIRPEHFPKTHSGLLELIHPEDRGAVQQSLHDCAAKEQPFSAEYRITLPDGSHRFVHSQAELACDESNREDNVTGTIQDITERKQAEEKIHFLAYYDSLTGLANRQLFKDRVTQALAYAQRHRCLLALLFLDLDRFKDVNDTLGHTIGDLLLQAVAERLKKCVRTSDSIARDADPRAQSCLARLGGDEFTVLLNNLAHPEDAGRVAQRIQRELANPFLLDRHEVFVTASIGISCFPADGSDLDSLLRNADAAMYSAKSLGPNMYHFYSSSMNEQAKQRLALQTDLRHAVDRRELVVHFQPQVDLTTGAVVGAEALIRWNHPTLGVLLPGRFLPVAEDVGMGSVLGEWVLRTACMQAKAWQATGRPAIRLAVNLSNSQFHDGSLAKTVAQVLADTGFPPELLDLELTETIVMRHPERSLPTLRSLRTLGVQLSLDDFGTGFSSLSHLQEYPITALKIDQSFVRNIAANQRDASITRTVIAMAHNLGLRVLAEGVETQDQLDYLREHGCEEVQGFLVSKPLPPDQFIEFLTEHRATSQRATRSSARRVVNQ
jgi:diguanylate cyclase (GGDEF)-like protein/PAS domain S-box-containing protein